MVVNSIGAIGPIGGVGRGRQSQVFTFSGTSHPLLCPFSQFKISRSFAARRLGTYALKFAANVSKILHFSPLTSTPLYAIHMKCKSANADHRQTARDQPTKDNL